MRRATFALYSALTLLCAGCPGTIEDPSIFLQDTSPANDAGSGEELDASGTDAGAAEDSSQPPPRDTGTSAPEAGPGEDAGGEDAGSDAAEPDAASDAAVTVSCDFDTLMAQRCGKLSICHILPAPAASLDLVSPDLATRLEGRSGTSACGEYLLLNPESPEQSALYLKVTDSPCGARMPLGEFLTPEDQTCILEWIQSQ